MLTAKRARPLASFSSRRAGLGNPAWTTGRRRIGRARVRLTAYFVPPS